MPIVRCQRRPRLPGGKAGGRKERKQKEEAGRGRTAASAAEGVKQIHVLHLVRDDEPAVGGDGVDLQRLVAAQSVERGQVPVAAAGEPPAVGAHRSPARSGDGDVILGHVVKELPGLEAGAVVDRGPRVRADGVLREELEGLEVVGPDGEGAGAEGAAAKVVAGVSASPFSPLT